jgi:outer membrane protein assembly factor BamB
MFGASESGAVFKIFSRTGKMVWRQVLPDGEKTDLLLLNKQTLFTVSASTGHAYMWQATDGALLWDRHLTKISSTSACDGKYAPVDLDDDGLDDVVVLANNAVTLLSSGGSGNPFWEFTPESKSETLVLLHVDDEGKFMYVVGVDEKLNKVVIHKLALNTGTEANINEMTGSPIARGGKHGSGIVLTESGTETYVAWTSSSNIVVANLANGKNIIAPVMDIVTLKGEDAMTLTSVSTDQSRPGVAPFIGYEVSTSKESFPGVDSQHGVLKIVGDGESEEMSIKQVHSYGKPAARSFSYGVSGGGTSTTGVAKGLQEIAFPVVVERLADSTSVSVIQFILNKAVEYDCSLQSISGGFEEHGTISSVFVDAYIAKTGSPKCRALIVSQDWSMQMVAKPTPSSIKKRKSTSSIAWEKRTEALANSMSVGMVDFAAIPIVSSTEYNYMDRLVGQSKYFTSIPSQLFAVVSMVQGFLEDKLNKNNERRKHPMTEEQLTNFGFNKLLISSSNCGKIIALKAETGEVVWERFIPGLISTHVLRNTMQIGSNPNMVAITNDKVTMETSFIELDASNGQIIGKKTYHLLNVKHTLIVPMDDDTSFLLTIDDKNAVTIYPDSKQAKNVLNEKYSSLYIRAYNPNSEENNVQGYGLSSPSKAVVRWSLVLPEDATLVAWSGVASVENVASPAHQQGNDGLLIKYLNPHVVVVAALQGTTLLVYMLDTVTGHIVRQYKHKDASGPVHVDRSENWAFVTYYNAEGRRTEISSIAMYEGEIEPDELNPWSKTPLTLQDDSNNDIGTVFSSFHAPDPVVLQKTFVFPVGIKSMVTTQSKRGITNKHLVLGLTSDQMLLLDRRILDPRRPADAPTDDDKKEGLFQYNPIIHYSDAAIVTYTKNIPRLKSIYSVPAELESTTLLLGVGLDIFYARSNPSRGFDLMPSDFSYAQLLLIVVGLLVGVMYAYGALRRKNLNQQWA